MTIHETLKNGTDFLTQSEINDAEISARFLLCHILDRDLTSLMGSLSETVSDDQLIAFQELLKRRASHEPLWQIVGTMPFGDLDILANKHVLIPRPETELLIDLAARYAIDHQSTIESIVEVGTGSGIIILSIADRLIQAGIEDIRLIASDISDEALEVAEINATTNGLPDIITFMQADLLPPVEADLVVANLPYIPSDRIATLAPEVRDFEPHLALDGGPDGLDLYRRLFAQIAAAPLQPQAIFCEIDETHGPLIRELVAATWPTAQITIHQDLAGHDRIAAITLDKSPKTT